MRPVAFRENASAMPRIRRRGVLAAVLATPALARARTAAAADGATLDIVSQRPGSPDAPLYAEFTRRTGIRVRFVPNPGNSALRALAGTPRGPGDVLLGTDAAALFPVERDELLEPHRSAATARVPPALRHPEDLWVATSVRARVLVVPAGLENPPADFTDLADPRFRGRLCSSPGLIPYNLSLVGRVVAHRGEAAAGEWARAVVANLAPGLPPAGDGDNVSAVAAGRCDVTVANHYDLARLHLPDASAEQRELASRVRLAWPGQQPGGAGAMRNVSAAGLLRGSPNREAAVRFLDYLVSDEAQRLAAGALFWPAVPGIPAPDGLHPLLDASGGEPRWDPLPVAALGAARPAAERIVRAANWPAPVPR